MSLMMSLAAVGFSQLSGGTAVYTNLCADMCETLKSNGTIVNPPHCMHLCIDTDHLKWALRNGNIHQIFNGTDRFDLTPDASAPGGYICQRTYFGRPPLHSMPFTMLMLDDGTVFNRSIGELDGYPNVDMFSHFRPAPDPAGERWQLMEYYVTKESTGLGKLLRVSCVQKAFPGVPGPLQTGERDWSANWTSTLPTFMPPLGVVCTGKPHAPSFQPSDSCRPECINSNCCLDPASNSSACFKVDQCSQLPGSTSQTIGTRASHSAAAFLSASILARASAWTSTTVVSPWFGGGDVASAVVA